LRHGIRSAMTNKKRAVSAILIFMTITCMIAGAIYAGVRTVRIHFLELLTTPLSPSTTSELCTILEITPNDPRCSDSAKSYAAQFFPELRGHYSSKTSRQVVDQEIGMYLVECSVHRTFSDGGYLACHYDFRGDRAYMVKIDYVHLYALERDVDPERRLEEAIWKVCTPAVHEQPNQWITNEVCN